MASRNSAKDGFSLLKQSQKSVFLLEGGPRGVLDVLEGGKPWSYTQINIVSLLLKFIFLTSLVISLRFLSPD